MLRAQVGAAPRAAALQRHSTQRRAVALAAPAAAAAQQRLQARARRLAPPGAGPAAPRGPAAAAPRALAGGAAAAAAAPSSTATASGPRLSEGRAAAALGLGTATANGPHEKNEDAAVIARLSRAQDPNASLDGGGPGPAAPAPAPAPGAGAGARGMRAHAYAPLSITAALAGCGLKSSDPASGNPGRGAHGARAVAAVSVAGIEDGGGGGGGAVLAHMAAVLDGHGGRGTAKWASRRLPHLVADQLARDPAGDLTAALSSALRSFERWWSDAMHDPAISRHGHDDSGSTACLALIAPAAGGWRLALANLGDSRALLVDADGGAEALSEMHNTGNPSELERLLAAGAQVVHPQAGAAEGGALADGHARFFPKGPIWGKRGLKVSRALGDVHFKRPTALVSTEPHCRELSLPLGGRHRLLLLLTDGVTDVLADGEVAALALAALARPQEERLPGLPAHDDDAQAAARAVVAAAAARDAAHDNMTCVAVVLG
ncbi:hypothetical protein Rsub_12571 [Raphidocelis subcapitata]|uniref:PPM-type phosphatase domain-containing protein n=1 Tax=Raphidocelis subcapitata TaxID=307507 RepID=A0A2V0PJ41_9CHLO|nr:hypothetical protein Rsub_12571 [Raphidocelis subcapitata]|eukprot:GBF99818.1 hypothetical protein Rsub_12571 [Raphidocelis subcapitata]